MNTEAFKATQGHLAADCVIRNMWLRAEFSV